MKNGQERIAGIGKKVPFGALIMICGGMAQMALAAEPPSDEELRSLIAEQTKRLEHLRQRLAEESDKLADVRKMLGQETLRSTRGGASGPIHGSESEPFLVAQASPQENQQPVGQSPARDGKPPAIAPIFDQPGVLTPRGKLVLEPGLQYGYSSSNRVSLVGYTIIPALLIGLIDVREVRRNTFTPSLTARWGITNRFEIEARLPYVYRSDSAIERPYVQGASVPELFSSTGKGIGDVEFTARYQLNDGGADRAYYVGSLRLKSRTGKDPFEVLSDTHAGLTSELQRELPTGSGFYTIQPALTMLYPADPAVFFGSISYQYNFKRSGVVMNTTDGPQAVGDVTPGGVFGFNFGMGLSLNDRSSFSIGYDHASVGKTQINGVVSANSVQTQLGTLLLGYSYRIDKKTSLNVSVGVGVTRDTPDIQLSVRLPITF